MQSILANNPLTAPHLHPHRLSPSRTLANSPSQTMQSRKRKADDEETNDGDTRMSRSPSASPSLSSGTIPQAHRIRSKRIRSNLSGRQLSLPRLLETLNQDELRRLLHNVCERHPDLNVEITSTAPRPSVDSVLAVLTQYEATFRSAFPFGGRDSSEYAYNRVRQPLSDLLDALKDYTPNFLPPNELQTGQSLKYLDAVTSLIHRIPDFDNYQNNRIKLEAYDELSRAWATVIKEAAKRGGGIQLRVGDWEQKLARHHQQSNNRLEAAIHQFQASLNWIAEQSAGATVPSSADTSSIRQQLLSGNYAYGQGEGVRLGPW